MLKVWEALEGKTPREAGSKPITKAPASEKARYCLLDAGTLPFEDINIICQA